jgi:hypothetical protein
LTVRFGANVNVRSFVLQLAVSAVHCDTSLNPLSLRVPVAPVAFVHVAAFQLTSSGAHVASPGEGGVNEDASACSDT